MADTGLAAFAALPADVAERRLEACCAAPGWARSVIEGRPYPDREALRAAADVALAAQDWAGVEAALAAHPRIGERRSRGGREDAWSAREQRGAADADATTRAELAAANTAYQRRFGHVFLICASGLSAGQMLAALRSRLGNEPEPERGVVRAELGKIIRIRLDTLLAELEAT